MFFSQRNVNPGAASSHRVARMFCEEQDYYQMRPYNFHTELAALHEQISQEHSLDVKYLPSKYPNIKPIQALLNGFLVETIDDKDERRKIRLEILSLWVEKKVESAYDLTVYQCSCIPDFLEINEDGSYGRRTKKFLSDSQAQAEGRDISGENEHYSLDNEPYFAPARLSDI
jgi:hypothetical protein